MKKQTKVVAVLSAAALLAMGASITSFAAGWEKDDEGIWHYYDDDGDMVTDEWKKDGSKWYYLDEDGNMLTDDWVDDDYYVGSDGAMLKNQWIKTSDDDDDGDDPDDNSDHWFYFDNKGKKYDDDDKAKTINGKTYYFDSDGHMRYGWHQDDSNDEVYYLGGEDEGWRAESQWLWLEKPGMNADDDDDDTEDDILGCSDDDDDYCDDEGWYWFKSSGKMYHGTKKKKINGYYFMFNEHGQMLYEWIDADTKVTLGSHAQLDGNLEDGASLASIAHMHYYKENGTEKDDGSRADGWYYIDGAEDMDTDGDTDWYYFDDGDPYYAEASDFTGLYDEGDPVYVYREKIDGKYFAFNEKGQMQDGLQLINHQIYCFEDDNGYQYSGKHSNVEEDDNDTYYYYFDTKKGNLGKGYNGKKDNTLYFHGKRCEADDDYRIYRYGDRFYLVNKSGKIQKSDSKKYDVEDANGGNELEDQKFEFNGDDSIKTMYDYSDEESTSYGKEVTDWYTLAEVPHIELYDNWITQDNGADVIINIQNEQNEYANQADYSLGSGSSKIADYDKDVVVNYKAINSTDDDETETEADEDTSD